MTEPFFQLCLDLEFFGIFFSYEEEAYPKCIRPDKQRCDQDGRKPHAKFQERNDEDHSPENPGEHDQADAQNSLYFAFHTVFGNYCKNRQFRYHLMLTGS